MVDKIPERLLRLHEYVVSAGAAYDDLTFGPVPDGEEWHVKWIASMDEDNAITKRGYAIKSGGSLYWLHEEAVTTAALRAGRKLEAKLSAGEELVVRLTGCTSSDDLHAWLTGLYWELQER
jgi:hypothetical protein